MTLSQYLNQADPVRRPTVIVEFSEVSIGRFIGAIGSKYAPVFINRIQAEYAVKEGSNLIYTTDEDGNPRRVSVFQFKHPIHEVLENSK